MTKVSKLICASLLFFFIFKRYEFHYAAVRQKWQCTYFLWSIRKIKRNIHEWEIHPATYLVYSYFKPATACRFVIIATVVHRVTIGVVGIKDIDGVWDLIRSRISPGQNLHMAFDVYGFRLELITRILSCFFSTPRLPACHVGQCQNAKQNFINQKSW